MRIRADNRPEGVYEKKIYFERMRLALVTIYSVLRIRTLSFRRNVRIEHCNRLENRIASRKITE